MHLLPHDLYPMGHSKTVELHSSELNLQVPSSHINTSAEGFFDFILLRHVILVLFDLTPSIGLCSLE